MVSQKLIIGSETGTHHDLSTQIVHVIQKVNTFRSQITISESDRKVNAKSMLGVLALGLHPDLEITITADGPDEADAIEAVSKMLA